MDDFVNPDRSGGAGSAKIGDAAVIFLRQLRPAGPWMLLAIDPESGGIEAKTIENTDGVRSFVAKHNGTRNLYYSLNPTRTRMDKKAAKTDIARIEYVPADLDPKSGEPPEDAKKRYLTEIGKFKKKPTAVIDSGNGLNVIFKLAKPIELPEPVRRPSGEPQSESLVFDDETQKVIADIEGRAAQLMKDFGSAAGTQNIDRILRLPGTTNLPTKAKIRNRRLPCQARLIEFNTTTFEPNDFPDPADPKAERAEARAKAESWRSTAGKKEPSKRLIDLLLVRDKGAGVKYSVGGYEYESRSGLLFGFLRGCIQEGISEDVICDCCIGDLYAGSAIREHCHDQQAAGIDPFDYLQRQIERTEEKYAASAEAADARASAGAGAGPPQPLILATPYEWIEPADIPMRDWLYGQLLVRGFVSLTAAPGGTGKSSLIVAETLSQLSGKDLIGVKPKERLRVWVWNLEDPQRETQRKIQAAALRYGLTKEDIGDRLFVDSGRDQSLVIAKMNRDGPAIARPVVDALVEQVIAKKINIIIIDPFVSCHEVPENDNGAQDMVVKEWGKVAERGSCAVHLIDHTRKAAAGTEVTTDSARGGKAKTDACRVVRVVNQMSKAEGEKARVENPRRYFRVYNDKANLAPPADKSDWFKLESVDLGNGAKIFFGSMDSSEVVEAREEGDNMGVVVRWEWPDPLEGVTVDDFDKAAEAIRAGKWRANSQAKDWVGIAVAEALDLDLNDEGNKTKVKDMIKAWLNRKALVEVTGKSGQYKDKKFVEVVEAKR